MFYYPAIPVNVQHSTWLGLALAAPSGRNAARVKRPGEGNAGVSFICPRTAPTLRGSQASKFMSFTLHRQVTNHLPVYAEALIKTT